MSGRWPYLHRWAKANAFINEFGNPEYPPWVCLVMNIYDERAVECRNLCEWSAPYGWVPEAGCPVHD